METNIINLKDDNNNAIIDAISAVLNELVATDLISDNNIIESYRNHNLDESKNYSYTILLPFPYGRNPDDDNLEAQTLIHKNIWHKLITILGNQLGLVITYEDHQIIYSNSEYLMIHYGDETIQISYHYTGQW